MSVFMPAKQMLAETLDIRSKQRRDLACKLVVAMEKAKQEEKTELNFYDLDKITNTVVDLVIQELRSLGYCVEYTSGQREGRYLTVQWGNA